jgi:hypothetical protein
MGQYYTSRHKARVGQCGRVKIKIFACQIFKKKRKIANIDASNAFKFESGIFLATRFSGLKQNESSAYVFSFMFNLIII